MVVLTTAAKNIQNKIKEAKGLKWYTRKYRFIKEENSNGWIEKQKRWYLENSNQKGRCKSSLISNYIKYEWINTLVKGQR